MQVILMKLENNKTESLLLRFVRFYHFISAQEEKGYSADFVIQVFDKVQPTYVTLIRYPEGLTNINQLVHADLLECDPP